MWCLRPPVEYGREREDEALRFPAGGRCWRTVGSSFRRPSPCSHAEEALGAWSSGWTISSCKPTLCLAGISFWNIFYIHFNIISVMSSQINLNETLLQVMTRGEEKCCAATGVLHSSRPNPISTPSPSPLFWRGKGEGEGEGVRGRNGIGTRCVQREAGGGTATTGRTDLLPREVHQKVRNSSRCTQQDCSWPRSVPYSLDAQVKKQVKCTASHIWNGRERVWILTLSPAAREIPTEAPLESNTWIPLSDSSLLMVNTLKKPRAAGEDSTTYCELVSFRKTQFTMGLSLSFMQE